MTETHWSKSPALNRFAAWAFFWLVAFGAVIHLVTGRWGRAVLYGIISIALWRWLTSPAYLGRLAEREPDERA